MVDVKTLASARLSARYTHWVIKIASTVDQSSSSMNGRLPMPGWAGCNPVSQTTFFPLCWMTQHDLPTSWPAPSMVMVSEGACSPPLITCTGAER